MTLWRVGLQLPVMPQGLNLSGMYAQMAQPVTMISWNIPMIFYMLCDGEPAQETVEVHNRFYESLDMTPEFRQYNQQLEQRTLQQSQNSLEGLLEN